MLQNGEPFFIFSCSNNWYENEPHGNKRKYKSFVLGIIWISFHAVIMIIVGRLIRAPFLFIAVGSQANIGGVASASL